jgi:Rieske Fe-S protein
MTQPLASRRIVITCPYHGSQYSSATGDVIAGPAQTGLDPVRITVADGRITQA